MATAKNTTATKGFDLSKNNLSKKAEDGYSFELCLPTGEATGAFLTVRGALSPKVKAFGKKKFDEMQRKETMARRKGRETDPITLDEAEEMAVESAGIRLLAWEGILEEGVEVEFNEANVKRILTDHSWIREEIIKASDELENFTKS